MEPIINITGNLVALGPLRKDLVSYYNKWNNDFQITRTLAVTGPVAFEEELAAYDEVVKSNKYIFFTIYEKKTMHPIGNTFLADIAYKHRRAEFNIVIGEQTCHGKGFGTEVTKLILDYAFQILGLHNVFLRVFEFNEKAIRVYEKAGFTVCGRRRQAQFMNGRLWDIIFMEALSTEER